jgi:SAM-dependent methyltransferase
VAGKGHRKFAAVWDWASRHESQSERRFRETVLAGANGRVLEIGYGVGANWRFLPPPADYTGIEPDPFMRQRAAAHLPGDRRLNLVAGDAHLLPFAGETFDTVIATLVYCSIPNVPKSLSEVRRVLKPDGELRFWEHVRSEGRLGAAAQAAIAPLWIRLAGGCHPNRRTALEFQRAGFYLTAIQHVKVGGFPAIVGVAVPTRVGETIPEPQ